MEEQNINRIDLHMHSLYSEDGEYTPRELIQMSQEAGLTHIAITDHNSVKGFLEGESYLRTMTNPQEQIHLIRGIELDCHYQGLILHLLGYGLEGSLEEFDKIEEDILDQELYCGDIRIQKVRELGIVFTEERVRKLSHNGVISGEVIAEAAMEADKEHKHPLLLPYYEGGARSDNPFVNFYWDYCAPGKPAYAEIHYLSLEDAIGVIRRAGGQTVLAHPGIYMQENPLLLQMVMACGIDGIEAFSSYHSKEQNDFYRNYADEHGYFVTCGSDFHGKIKPAIALGCISAEGREDRIRKALNVG